MDERPATDRAAGSPPSPSAVVTRTLRRRRRAPPGRPRPTTPSRPPGRRPAGSHRAASAGRRRDLQPRLDAIGGSSPSAGPRARRVRSGRGRLGRRPHRGERHRRAAQGDRRRRHHRPGPGPARPLASGGGIALPPVRFAAARIPRPARRCRRQAVRANVRRSGSQQRAHEADEERTSSTWAAVRTSVRTLTERPPSAADQRRRRPPACSASHLSTPARPAARVHVAPRARRQSRDRVGAAQHDRPLPRPAARPDDQERHRTDDGRVEHELTARRHQGANGVLSTPTRTSSARPPPQSAPSILAAVPGCRAVATAREPGGRRRRGRGEVQDGRGGAQAGGGVGDSS